MFSKVKKLKLYKLLISSYFRVQNIFTFFNEVVTQKIDLNFLFLMKKNSNKKEISGQNFD